MSDLVLRGICKSYQSGVSALAPLDLDVASGEFVVLLGPSGCGKSTLLRLIAGLEQPSGGSILLGGRDITNVPPSDRDIAMVFQSYALYPHMSVSENVGFGLRMRNVSKPDRKRAIHDVAEQLELGDYLDRKPGQLSGGQRQRVALARAIVRNPKLFLFDEPLSNLDAALRASTRTELRRLHQRLSATTLYVTHDQGEAMSMADRLVVMRAGSVEQIGTPLEVYRRPANRFVATFIGSPPMRLLRADVQSGTLSIAGAAWSLERTGVSGPVHAGVRAEHLSISQQPAPLTIPVTILLVEAMGNETLLTCALPDGQEVIVRAHPAEQALPGATRHLSIDFSQASFFDFNSGRALLLDPLTSDASHQIAL